MEVNGRPSVHGVEIEEAGQRVRARHVGSRVGLALERAQHLDDGGQRPQQQLVGVIVPGAHQRGFEGGIVTQHGPGKLAERGDPQHRPDRNARGVGDAAERLTRARADGGDHPRHAPGLEPSAGTTHGVVERRDLLQGEGLARGDLREWRQT